MSACAPERPEQAEVEPTPLVELPAFGSVLHTVQTEHPGGINSAAVAHLEGQPVVITTGYGDPSTAPFDDRVEVRRVDGGVLLHEFSTGHAGGARFVAAIQIGESAVAVTTGFSDHVVKVWDLSDGRQADEWDLAGSPASIVISAIDDTPTVHISYNSEIETWDLLAGERLGEPHVIPGVLLGLAHVDGDSVAVTLTGDLAVGVGLAVFSLTTAEQRGEPLTVEGHRTLSGAVGELDGAPVVVSGGGHDFGGDAAVRIWRLTDGQQLGEALTGHDDAVSAVALTTVDGVALAVSGSADHTVRVWELGAGRQIGEPWAGHTGTVTTVLTGDFDEIPVAVTGSRDNTVRVWSLANP